MSARHRPKMTLADQAAFLAHLRHRTETRDAERKGPPVTADETWLRLSADEVGALETIEQTLLTFELHGADKYVRDRVRRRGQR